MFYVYAEYEIHANELAKYMLRHDSFNLPINVSGLDEEALTNLIKAELSSDSITRDRLEGVAWDMYRSNPSFELECIAEVGYEPIWETTCTDRFTMRSEVFVSLEAFAMWLWKHDLEQNSRILPVDECEEA